MKLIFIASLPSVLCEIFWLDGERILQEPLGFKPWGVSEIRRRFAVFLSNAYTCNMTVAVGWIRTKFAREAFEFSLHAIDQTILHGISVSEIRGAIQTGEIIEDYPDDKYGPSCLILGFTETGRPLLFNAATLDSH